jgi:hypothetical protein
MNKTEPSIKAQQFFTTVVLQLNRSTGKKRAVIVSFLTFFVTFLRQDKKVNNNYAKRHEAYTCFAPSSYHIRPTAPMLKPALKKHTKHRIVRSEADTNKTRTKHE